MSAQALKLRRIACFQYGDAVTKELFDRLFERYFARKNNPAT
jgi:hypothetical protein